jgi:hypothetical protein
MLVVVVELDAVAVAIVVVVSGSGGGGGLIFGLGRLGFVEIVSTPGTGGTALLDLTSLASGCAGFTSGFG